MKKISRAQLRQLIERDSQPSLSLYMPTYRCGREVRQNPIRLKNLIKIGEAQLRDLSLDEARVNQQIAAAKELLGASAEEFWQHAGDGFALFAGPEHCEMFRLPISFPELVVVSRRFHIKPLLEYFQGDGRYFVLAASAQRVRLLEGTKYNLDEVDAETLPDNLVEALNIDEYVSSLQFHSFAAGGSGSDQAIYHGHGGGSDADKKEELLQYFRRLDDALQNHLDNEQAPLVFAGVDYLFPLFKQASNYRNLVDEPVTGNPDNASAQDLHQPSWKIVQSRFAEERSRLNERFGLMASRNLASSDLTDIISASRAGRIETLLVAQDEQRWGTIDEQTGKVEKSENNLPENQDLLDYAATKTLLAGGNIYLVQRQADMPGDSPIAAFYRFAQ